MGRTSGVHTSGSMFRFMHQRMEKLSDWVTDWASGSWAFLLAMCAVVVWLCLGPMLHYGENWYVLITVPTTIFTFVLVFIIQRSQRKESMVLQIKLNELIVSQKGARNHLVDVESLSEEELQRFLDAYAHLAHSAASRRADMVTAARMDAAADPAVPTAPAQS